jgi:hypothetical protein
MTVRSRTILLPLAVLLAALSISCSGEHADVNAAGRECPAQAAATEPGEITYGDALLLIAGKRSSVAADYRKASGRAAREEALTEAGDLLRTSVDETLFPYWYGTKWDYNGTTEVPGQGTIACGYFVTTVLRDAGVRLDRVKLARMASERMIKCLAGESHIRRFRNAPLADFVADIAEWGEGLYIVGLDTHTGFIVHTGEDIFFVHSQGYGSEEVVRERAAKSPVLRSSRYRVLGKISEDDAFIDRWLCGKEFPPDGD